MILQDYVDRLLPPRSVLHRNAAILDSGKWSGNAPEMRLHNGKWRYSSVFKIMTFFAAVPWLECSLGSHGCVRVEIQNEKILQ